MKKFSGVSLGATCGGGMLNGPWGSPAGIHGTPLRDHCNFTEHRAEMPLTDYSYKYLGYISFFLALFRFDYDTLFKTAVTTKSLFASCLLHRCKTLKVFSWAITTTESDNEEHFKHFAPTRLLSERCTLYHKVAHPSVPLPSCTGMS